MSERNLERRLRSLLHQYGVTHKHVDGQAGVPDISFSLRPPYRLDGWIEFKWGKNWVWSAEQRLWMMKRGRTGCAGFLIHGAGSTINIWRWDTALAGEPPDKIFQKTPTAEELCEALCEGTRSPG